MDKSYEKEISLDETDFNKFHQEHLECVIDNLFKEAIKCIEFYNEGTDWCYEETISTLEELKESIKKLL